MDIMTMIGWGCAVVTLASGFCALTPTPDPATPWGKIYRYIEMAGLLVGKAKQDGLVPANPVADRLDADILTAAKDMLGKGAFVLAISGGLMLSACTGGAMNEGTKLAQDAGAMLGISLSADEVAQMKMTCAAVQPDLAIAASPSVPAKVAEVAVYPKALCDQLLTGQVPPTLDSNSPKWLDEVLKGTAVAAQVAGIVLPKLLPLLMAL